MRVVAARYGRDGAFDRLAKRVSVASVCPVSVEGNVLTVATADPLNPVIFDDLTQSTKGTADAFGGDSI